jgi:hypothetical protein
MCRWPRRQPPATGEAKENCTPGNWNGTTEIAVGISAPSEPVGPVSHGGRFWLPGHGPWEVDVQIDARAAWEPARRNEPVWPPLSGFDWWARERGREGAASLRLIGVVVSNAGKVPKGRGM